MVTWGDGSTTPAACQVAPLGGASFGASHGYASPGSFTMTVTLVDRGGVTVSSTAPVTVARQGRPTDAGDNREANSSSQSHD